MIATLSEAYAKASRQVAMHLHVDLRAVDEARTNNGWLIFRGHNATVRPTFCGCSSARLYPAAMRPRLNALFAISVNSPSMSMVNFSCCVCSARFSGARGVTRRLTPQPMRAAVRMEAGVDV
jgi:hypothetical protein